MTIDTPSAASAKVSKTANGLANKADTLADKAESKISKLADRAEKAAHRAETVLHDGIETLRTQSRAYADQAVDKWDTTSKAVSEHVREKPIQGLAIAAGVGLVLGLLLGQPPQLIVGRTLAAVTALIVLATATTIAVVAAAFALYFVLDPLVGRAGACAILAGSFALIVAIAVLIAASKTNGHHHNSHHSHSAPDHDFSLIERVIEMAKDKPILSIGAAVAAGLIAIRNPALVATIIAAVMQPKRDD